jgi:6-pyruvoyltetrahydropterin/6-carboxytetrahydropterin synthase
MQSFHIRVANDDLVFCAAHFITLAGDQCERLHGHSYRVVTEISGPLDENQYVIDFLVVRSILKELLAELDHRMLLPTDHPLLRVVIGPLEVEVTFADRRWVFPRSECVVLPIRNTTSELLARYLGQRLLDAVEARTGTRPESLRLEVHEGTGFAAVCQWPPPHAS